MPSDSQDASSTNWKPGSALSKPIQMSSDTTKVNTVVNSATERMLRRPDGLSSRIHMMRNAPTSGRKVTVVRIGQSVMI
jgi:hypothetical protein